MTNREIKFRAWNVNEKEFTFMDFDISDFRMGWKIEHDGSKKKEHFIFNQNTGLKDKTGKEIYEGDLVVLGNDTDKEFPRQIIWRNNGFFCQQIKKPDFNFPLTFVNITKEFENSSDTDWEIIGNIYENKN